MFYNLLRAIIELFENAVPRFLSDKITLYNNAISARPIRGRQDPNLVAKLEVFFSSDYL